MATSLPTMNLVTTNLTATNFTAAGSRILRDNAFVSEVVVRPEIVENMQQLYASPKVLSQTPRAGSLVARGSKVNLVMTNGRVLPGGAIAGGFTAWQERPLGSLYDDFLKNDATMSALVSKYAESQTLTEAERGQALTTLQAKGVEVGGDAGSDLNAVMVALGAAKAFGV